MASLGNKYAKAEALARLNKKASLQVNFQEAFLFNLLSLSLATYYPRVGAICQI